MERLAVFCGVVFWCLHWYLRLRSCRCAAKCWPKNVPSRPALWDVAAGPGIWIAVADVEREIPGLWQLTRAWSVEAAENLASLLLVEIQQNADTFWVRWVMPPSAQEHYDAVFAAFDAEAEPFLS